ncbi:ExbD/TolR family protein [Chondromyces apiculatus]|uniref:Biopolymer transport protein, ExbD/TolR family n=1 Tax=Chondromyces apiculatus DSM 436 TaxID=1192034 RepID=A0A017T740_9BACT|nr:biopolymer transporter ExbD [Chondromyces apiculatus]EYF04605.1 biopolymer transport protein, ExbD/TolR family [Chondromyces apiculatus DSM 436]
MGMGVQGGGRKNEIRPSMNVTPLVDVVLVLLIIFMVVTPLLAKQMWLNLPKKDEDAKNEPPPGEKDKPVVVTVDRDGTVRINQSPVERAALRDKLGRIIAARAESVIYFDAHDEADYAVAVEVMDLARMGGARTIAVLTENAVR